MEVQKIATWVPFTDEALADGALIQRSLRWSMESEQDYQSRPNTEDEERDGWRSFTDSTGLTSRYAVGWRIEQQHREYEAEREAEMAACSYVSCTCGHHED